jgi:hypothetical protein
MRSDGSAMSVVGGGAPASALCSDSMLVSGTSGAAACHGANVEFEDGADSESEAELLSLPRRARGGRAPTSRGAGLGSPHTFAP